MPNASVKDKKPSVSQFTNYMAGGIRTFRAFPRYEGDKNKLVKKIRDQVVKQEMSYETLHKRSGLANKTISRLLSEETRFPQLTTIWKACEQVGLKIEIVEK